MYQNAKFIYNTIHLKFTYKLVAMIEDKAFFIDTNPRLASSIYPCHTKIR
jgi:hypothetical protein